MKLERIEEFQSAVEGCRDQADVTNILNTGDLNIVAVLQRNVLGRLLRLLLDRLVCLFKRLKVLEVNDPVVLLILLCVYLVDLDCSVARISLLLLVGVEHGMVPFAVEAVLLLNDGVVKLYSPLVLECATTASAVDAWLSLLSMQLRSHLNAPSRPVQCTRESLIHLIFGILAVHRYFSANGNIMRVLIWAFEEIEG